MNTWKDELVRRANAEGIPAALDWPTPELMAEARDLFGPDDPAGRLAGDLAADLTAKAREPVSHATCEALVRAAANLRGLLLTGCDPVLALDILSAAAAKLESSAT